MADVVHDGPPLTEPCLEQELMRPQERWRNTIQSMQQLVRTSAWDLRDDNTFTSIAAKKVAFLHK